MSLISELRRRNVFRVGVAYVVLGWLLLQVTDVVVPILALPDWVAKFVLFLLVLGFPLVLFFGWAYELTPEGLKREHEVDRLQSTTRNTGRKLDRAIIAVLLVALSWFAWDRYRPVAEAPQAETAIDTMERQTSPSVAETGREIPVIAVLPFKASGSDDGGFLASGLHDDLLTRLAKLDAFRVISRTSMMNYANTTKNMRLIGEEVGAGFILEGGVQALGNRVRINAQLIDAPTDEHIWAEIYNRDLTANNLFDVQAELAKAIAESLHAELSPADLLLVNEVPTEDMDAYSAYLRGIQSYASTGYIGTDLDRQAVSFFEQAVELDPGFAVAWAGLATARIRDGCCTWDLKDSAGVLEALDRSRALQPGLLESELAWAEYLYRFKKEYGRALETLEALGERVKGNADALQLMAWLNRRLGRYDVAFATLKKALKLEPLSPAIHRTLAMYAWQMDDCESAGRYLEQLRFLEPDEPSTRVSTAEFELECNGNAGRAADLVRDVDFPAYGGWTSAIWAAWKARDVRLYLSLNALELPAQGSYWPIWQQMNLAAVYRFLEPNAVLSNQALEKAEKLLQSYGSDADLAQGEMFALLNTCFSALRGDSEQTRHWIEEHRRRYREQYKGDLSEEANNHFDYASSYAIAGLHDEAVEELRIMFENPGGHRFPYVDGAPEFEMLEDDPGYIALRQRFGQP